MLARVSADIWEYLLDFVARKHVLSKGLFPSFGRLGRRCDEAQASRLATSGTRRLATLLGVQVVDADRKLTHLER
jgi:hypothetical protein